MDAPTKPRIVTYLNPAGLGIGWTAWRKGNEDKLFGYGATEQDAIIDLIATEEFAGQMEFDIGPHLGRNAE